MRFFDVGQEANGFIAVGQVATGFIAIGQLATGVIAIGQVARGVFCVGMGSFGLFSIGMTTIGVVSGAGMIGISGVYSRGVVFSLFPFLPRRRKVPPSSDYEAVSRGRVTEGWVEAEIARGPDGKPALKRRGEAVPARFVVELTRAAESAAENDTRVFAHLVWRGQELVCDRLHERPTSPLLSPALLVVSAARVVALVAVVIAFYELVGMPIIESVAGPLLSTTG